VKVKTIHALVSIGLITGISLIGNSLEVNAQPQLSNTSATGNSIPFLNKSSITILSHNSYVDSIGYFHVVGEVENNTPSTAEFVQITGTFYDINNAVVGTQFTYTNPSDISSGGKAPFDLVLMSASVPTSLIDHYNLVASYQ
jgi:hypothetical protein